MNNKFNENKKINFLNNALKEILAIYLKNNENFEYMEKNDKNKIFSIVKKIEFNFNFESEIVDFFKNYFNHSLWNSNYYYFVVKNGKNIITIM